jgi:hypothetical protein
MARKLLYINTTTGRITQTSEMYPNTTELPVSTPRTFGWSFAAVPETGVVVAPVYTADVDMTLTGVRIYADTAPTGGALEFDIERWNGSSWATVFSTRPTVSSGANRGGSGAAFSITAISAGHELRLNVISVNTAASITVQLFATVGVL